MAAPTTTLSIVSHGQGALVEQLLGDLRHQGAPGCEIILTLNVPEPESFLSRFPELPLAVIRNRAPLGFGANHNQAFEVSRGDTFVVVNPDIRLPDPGYLGIVRNVAGNVGVCAPLIKGSDGVAQDSARKMPTLARLYRRRVLRDLSADYRLEDEQIRVDWVAGMFAAFAREAFAAVGGFDERYFMYMEDADICQRLWQAGWEVVVDPSICVIHDARRASWRSPRHLAWHVDSTVRFLTGRWRRPWAAANRTDRTRGASAIQAAENRGATDD